MFHDLNLYLATLTINGALVLLGHVGDLDSMLSTVRLVTGRRSAAGSAIGGIGETREPLDFCGKLGITSEVDVIKIQEIKRRAEYFTGTALVDRLAYSANVFCPLDRALQQL